MLRSKALVLIFSIALLLCARCYAQPIPNQQAQVQVLPPQLQPPHPPAKAAQRYEVDAKRMGVDVNSEDALPRSREFKRIDSTYYVGWLFEGAYKYNHAADYLGFKNACVPLEHALRLEERDYRKALATRASSVMEYYPVFKFHIDYTLTAMYLMNCYSNTDQPDKVYQLLRRVLRWNFQRDFYMDAYNYLGWTVHRNRFYTSEKYPFLKNSIVENERLAQRYLDSGLRKIERDKALNSKIFPPGYELQDKMAVYHYKTILYSYSFNIDSAMYFFNLMRAGTIFPHNNYATFRAVCGDFRDAESEYKQASTQDAPDKRLQEWAYYSSILDIYKSAPGAGAEMMKDMIRAAGSTPGFGWYNIGLARCLFYDGQTGESKRYTDKAAGFKELHIGTTLGETHYDFSIQLLKLLNKQNEWQMQEFEHRNWWYNPPVLARMGKLLSEKYLQQFLIISQFSQNPERDRVIYKLFSTEGTVSWDEIWYLIRDFSTRFFLDRFQMEAKTDNRKFVHKYFRFFVARLQMKQGNYKEATKILDNILSSPETDQQYEKLFIARLFQAEAECAAQRNDKAAVDDWMYRMYQVYPQLLPFTGMTCNMNLHVSGQVDAAVLGRLKDCNINEVDPAVPAPKAYLNFTTNGKRKTVNYYVLARDGSILVANQSFAYQNAEEAGVALAYRLFNIGGKEAVEVKEKEPAKSKAK